MIYDRIRYVSKLIKIKSFVKLMTSIHNTLALFYFLEILALLYLTLKSLFMLKNEFSDSD